MEENTQDGYSPPHVLIFPLPVQGHINPMLNLAQLLCLANINVTFLVTSQNHQLLTQHTNIESRFACYPGFRFKVVPEEAPEKQRRTVDEGVDKEWLIDLIHGLEVTAKSLLRDMFMVGSGNATTSRVTCLIVDGWLTFAYDVANEAEIPVIAFRCPSASCIWAYFCTPKLIQAGEIPFQDEEMDQLVENVPGMNTYIRYRDLPSFCRNQDKSSCKDLERLYDAEIQRTQKAHALILNTFEDLDAPILSQIRSQCSRVYSIGPLHLQLKQKLGFEHDRNSSFNNSSSSLWEVDKSCLTWLDEKPDKSVVYVSFGSLTVLKTEQLVEIWAGLVQSNKYFLWVVRPNLIYGSECNTSEFLDGTKERGCIVSWCSQEEVLAHRAVGGFLTHSGWNSTIESIVAGVPMLCWPYFADQQINSRVVSEVWGIGLDMKDTCDRNVVEKMINELMEIKKDEFEKCMIKWSDLAKKTVMEGGSSYTNFELLIEDIKGMSTKTQSLL